MASNGSVNPLFPPSSVLRRVHRERAVGLLYGQRALAIGATDPRNFVGTLAHTRYPDRPFARLAATARMFESVFFGDRAEAERVLAAVEGMHRRVRGTMPRDEGPVRAGTPYAAHDPDLMLWTVAVAADSAHRFHELLVRPLERAESDAFWRDYVRFGELFGMPASVAPTSWREFREYFDTKVNGSGAHLTAEARHVGRAVMLEIPAARWQWGAMRIHNVVVLGALPERVRELYGLAWTAAHEAAFRAAVAAHRATRPLLPGSVLRGRNTAHFARVVAAERRIVRAGRPAPGALAPLGGVPVA
jgi:uncharacterized protein (DUF2236 family)